MSHAIVFGPALAAVPLCVACEKDSSEAERTSAAESDFAKAREDYRPRKRDVP